MKTHTRMPLVVISLALVARALATDFVLVADGRPQAEIVLAEREATGPVLFAVQELQRYVKDMSGALLPIVQVATLDTLRAQGVVVTADVQAAVATGASQLSSGSDDHYLLHVSEKRITILGSSPRAALFATYDLLERLGCGWCVPGDDSVPKRSTLSISALELDTAPAFQYRMMLDFPLMSAAQSLAIVDWIAKN